MNDLINKIARGLPPLLGVLGGIYIFRPGDLTLAAAILAVGFVAGLAARMAGIRAVKSRPMLGWFLNEWWILAAISIIALSTAVVLWVTVNADSLVPVASDAQSAVSGALVGAVTAFLAVLWTKDIEEGAGIFWPATSFKKGLKERFNDLTKEADPHAYYAVHYDQAYDGSFAGWGFIERRKRAGLLQIHVNNRRQQPPAPAPQPPASPPTGQSSGSRLS